ncbi:2-hydroxyhexa-2,4-dienoate hydratase [compost metagenome]|uniref:2-keto-4-pentenoate hydratase n=1 Tax=Achromobacter sp. Root83 TaxID=1736602 RepID=UPI00070B7FEB|nr:fumarylacetoacetate hydrolase family protein [Achromobacter sp. Root83]KRC84581.1 decarboxylase [Achromobacter sp. Root83]
MSAFDPESLARQVLAAQDGVHPLTPFTARYPGFSLEAAYDVAARVRRTRAGAGAVLAGRKIGFTNAAMWAALGVDFPVWGSMYAHTVVHVAEGEARCSLGGYMEPRIEPEIVLRFHAVPPATSDLAKILACVDGIAHGFELVQSHFPAWQFQAADTVADGALHGALFVGPFEDPARLGPDLQDKLERFRIELSCDGVRRETGGGANVLGSPLAAMAHLLGVLADRPADEAFQAGELVTTGTLTRAYPVHAGQTWSTALDGIGLPGLRIAFED